MFFYKFHVQTCQALMAISQNGTLLKAGHKYWSRCSSCPRQKICKVTCSFHC